MADPSSSSPACAARRRRRWWVAALLVVATLGGGCNLKAHNLNPNPTFDVEPTGRTLHIQVSDEVPEHVLTEGDFGIQPADIQGWRAAVLLGATRGLRTGFRLMPVQTDAALTLLIESATPRLVPIGFSADGASTQFTASIDYRLRVFDRGLRPVDDKAGTVTAPGLFDGVDDCSALLDRAIVELVRVADQMLRTVEVPPAPAPPPDDADDLDTLK